MSTGLLDRVKTFVKKHITTDSGSTYVDYAESLEIEYLDMRTYCGDYPDMYELDYYIKIVSIIKNRIRRKNGHVRFPKCTSHAFKIGAPVIVNETQWTGFLSSIILLTVSASSLFQFVRGQIDGELSAYSQVFMAIGALLSTLYFYTTGQISFLIPQLGALIMAAFQLFALTRHQDHLFEQW